MESQSQNPEFWNNPENFEYPGENALASLCICAGSLEPSLPDNAISTRILSTGTYSLANLSAIGLNSTLYQ